MIDYRSILMPTPADVEQAKSSYWILSEHPNTGKVDLTVRGNNGESEIVILPGLVVQILTGILSATAAGNAISLTSYNQELSTQHAADLLSVSGH